MLLTHNELVKLVEAGVIENFVEGSINGASIDIHLGSKVLTETSSNNIINLAAKENLGMHELEMRACHWLLHPGDFVLAHTLEIFHMPDDIAAEYKLKSSLARNGLGHALAGWADPGWHNSTLTLELRNDLSRTALMLRPGMPIGQMVFWRGEAVPPHASYRNRGQYNNDRTVTPSKGVR